MEEKLERIYTIALGKAYEYNRLKRTPRAVKIVREFLFRHMKGKRIVLSAKLNEYLWERSIQKPPRKMKIRAIREGNKVNAYLATEKIEEKKPAEGSKTTEKKEDIGKVSSPEVKPKIQPVQTEAKKADEEKQAAEDKSRHEDKQKPESQKVPEPTKKSNTLSQEKKDMTDEKK